MVRRKFKNNLLENLNFDDPTLAETEEHQRMAEELQYSYMEIYHRADFLLKNAGYKKTPAQRAIWLKKAGYNGVNIPNRVGIPFDEAIKLGYSDNIHAMFNRELIIQGNRKKEAEKYVFIKPKRAC